LPAALEQARIYALPGRESATANAVMWELRDLQRRLDSGPLAGQDRRSAAIHQLRRRRDP
jgi:hypothetical protein